MSGGTGVVNWTGVDLTLVTPAHPDRAAALLLGDVGRQDTIAEDRVIQVQVALFLFFDINRNLCSTKGGQG